MNPISAARESGEDVAFAALSPPNLGAEAKNDKKTAGSAASVSIA